MQIRLSDQECGSLAAGGTISVESAEGRGKEAEDVVPGVGTRAGLRGDGFREQPDGQTLVDLPVAQLHEAWMSLEQTLGAGSGRTRVGR